MNLSIPPQPPILAGHSTTLYHKWFAFWSLPLERKADLVDGYPDLIIERPTSVATAMSGGPKVKVYLDPAVLDYKVPDQAVYRNWDRITHSDTYPVQGWHQLKQPFDTMTEDDQKLYLFSALTPLNFALVAYKYRYTARPEQYSLDMDYEHALRFKITVAELLTFYDHQGKN